VSALWLVVLISGVALLLVLLGVLGLRRLAARKARQQGQARQDLERQVPGKPDMALSKRPLLEARHRLKSAHRDIYQVPWSLLVGEAGPERRLLLNTLTHDSPSGRPHEKDAEAERWTFWAPGSGFAFDAQGEAFMDEGLRKQLLSYFRRERPLRPLDSVVLTLPVTDLLALGEAGRARREAAKPVLAPLAAGTGLEPRGGPPPRPAGHPESAWGRLSHLRRHHPDR